MKKKIILLFFALKTFAFAEEELRDDGNVEGEELLKIFKHRFF